jgi:hypothetical protein
MKRVLCDRYDEFVDVFRKPCKALFSGRRQHQHELRPFVTENVLIAARGAADNPASAGHIKISGEYLELAW